MYGYILLLKFLVVEGEWSASCLGSRNLDSCMLKFYFCHNYPRICSHHISFFCVCIFCCYSLSDNYILMGDRSNCKMYKHVCRISVAGHRNLYVGTGPKA
jgi:hypothetical protein